MNQERLIGTAKKLDKIFKALQIVNCVAAVIAILGVAILSAAYWVNPKNVNTRDVIIIALGEFSLELAQIETGIDLAYGCANCVWLVALMIVLYIGFCYVRKILIPMMEGNPFDPLVAECLKKLSFVTFVYGIVGNVGSSLMTYLKMNHYQLEQLADGQKILSVIPKYDLELGFLIVFFVFLLASYIFRYGAELQQLSDETL